MLVPLSCLRSRETNFKIKIIENVKMSIKNDYDSVTTHNKLYQFVTNYRFVYGNELFEYPLYCYAKIRIISK